MGYSKKRTYRKSKASKKSTSRRRHGGLFGYDVRGSMAKAVGKDEDAFKPADMGMMKKATEMGAKVGEMGHQGMEKVREKMQPAAAPAPVTRGGKKKAKKTKKTKKAKKAKKAKKTKKAKKSRKGRKKAKKSLLSRLNPLKLFK